jgi:hypothetical protein
MPVFQLYPNRGKLDDPAWLMSRHRGPCIVVADAAEAARRYANCAFIFAIAPPGLPSNVLTLPWSQPDLVTVVELCDAATEAVAATGSVLVNGRTVHDTDDAATPPGTMLQGDARHHRMAPSADLAADPQEGSALMRPAGATTKAMEARLPPAV